MTRLLILALFLCAGCATRKPGGVYNGVTSYETRTIDGMTETYIGIGVRL